MPLWQRLYKENPLADFEPTTTDLRGWNSTSPVFEQMIELVQPRLIIEVGAWKGASAIHMAKLAPRAEILCIDTWLGSSEMWDYPDLNREHGYPTLYRTFASNVVTCVGRERIVPMALSSTAAAYVLKAREITADLIYIDGSHDYEDVRRDLEMYWPLVRRGGALIGDDYAYPGVCKAAREVLPYHEVRWEKYVSIKG